MTFYFTISVLFVGNLFKGENWAYHATEVFIRICTEYVRHDLKTRLRFAIPTEKEKIIYLCTVGKK